MMTICNTIVYNNVFTGLIPPERIDVESVSDGDAKTGLLVFTEDQNIKIGDPTVEYAIRCQDDDSHGGGHSSVISWIPAPPPIPGPILTLRNKTGHFHSSGPVELEFAAYTNGGTESPPKELQLTIDSATQTVTDFPHIETVSGDGLLHLVNCNFMPFNLASGE